MDNSTKLSDLAKEIEYLKNKRKEIEVTIVPEVKSTILFNDATIEFDSAEATEFIHAITTIIDHGILRLSGELRKEI